MTQLNNHTSAPKFNGVYGIYFVVVDVCSGCVTKWCSWIAQGY